MASLYEQMTGTPNYDDILNSNLSREQKAQAIRERGAAYDKSVDKNKWKNIGRAFAGSLVSGTSFHPVLNIPYVGTGIGGALYDLGQGIAEGDKLPELAKRTGRGFVIGETVGAVPYVGKAASKTKVGQAVGNSAPVKAVGEGISKAGEKFANTKLYDALMTDIRAFNPNKQTVYHGSPYDFNKFSNEAIGTGEGAQAHGMGHYSALNKDVAEGYANRLGHYSLDNPDKIALPYGTDTDIIQANYFGKEEQIKRLQNQIEIQKDLLKTDPDNSFAWQAEIDNLNTRINNLNKYYDKFKLKADKQLYKLSVPKDDVMLREDALMSNQPNMSNLWDEIRLDRVNKSTTSLPKFKMALGANDIDINKTFNTNYFNDALEMVKNNPEQYKDLFLKDMTGRELYGYLENVLGSRKAATEYLQQRGIKGISYNGGIDGEARVIFNPDDIDIVRKYYNQPGLYEQIIGKQNTGSLVDALLNR